MTGAEMIGRPTLAAAAFSCNPEPRRPVDVEHGALATSVLRKGSRTYTALIFASIARQTASLLYCLSHAGTQGSLYRNINWHTTLWQIGCCPPGYCGLDGKADALKSRMVRE